MKQLGSQFRCLAVFRVRFTANHDIYFFYGDELHHVTYQTNEGIIKSVELFSDVGYDNEGYFLKISITPMQNGDLILTIPSIESNMFEDYCVEFNGIPDSHYFFYLIDGQEVEHEEISKTATYSIVKLHYEANAELIELVLACLI